MNRLKGCRVYLAGPMDRVADGGVGWRRKITPFLWKKGINVYDPTNKPIDIGVESDENRQHRSELKMGGCYSDLAADVKIIRATDLRMVDISDFLIVYLNMDVHACGTYEELFLANRQKKPIIVMVEQGKHNAPDWLFGTIPHEMIFSDWYDVEDYIIDVDTGYNCDDSNRWVFFDHSRTQPCLTTSQPNTQTLLTSTDLTPTKRGILGSVIGTVVSLFGSGRNKST